MAAIGTVISVRPQANCWNRDTVVTVLAMSQKSTRDLRKRSVNVSTLPPGHRDKRTVTVAHPSRQRAIFISRVTISDRPSGGHGGDDMCDHGYARGQQSDTKWGENVENGLRAPAARFP